MTTTDDIMKLYSECGVGCPLQNEHALRAAISALVAERDALLKALIEVLQNTPAIDYLTRPDCLKARAAIDTARGEKT